MKKILKLLYGIFLTYFYSQNDKDIFVCNRGIGDTLFFCTYLRTYKEQNKNLKITLIAVKNHRFFIELYRDYINEVIYISEFKCSAMCKAFTHDMASKNMRFVFPKDAMLYLGYRGIRINDLPKVQLGLSSDVSMYFPEKKVNRNRISLLFEKYHLNGKKLILISPNAVTLSKININVWTKIARYYTDNGYQVLTNLKNQKEKRIEGTIGICEDLETIFELSKCIEKFIGLRSGLCDLLAFSTCEMLIIYPNDRSDNSIKNKFSLCGLGFEKKIIEIEEDKVMELYDI